MISKSETTFCQPFQTSDRQVQAQVIRSYFLQINASESELYYVSPPEYMPGSRRYLDTLSGAIALQRFPSPSFARFPSRKVALPLP